VAPNGAWPLRGEASTDVAHLREYLTLAATPDGFERYLDRHVRNRRAT
jgi:hypothetical protein